MTTYFILLVFFMQGGEPATHAFFAETLTACHQAGAGFVLEMRNRDGFESPAYSCHMIRALEAGTAL